MTSDDAEGAAVVAAFGDFQIRVVARRQLDALRRHEIDEGIVFRRGRHIFVHGPYHFFIGVCTGYREHLRMRGADRVRLLAHAACNDDAAVFLEGLTNGVQRFLLGAVDEAAGIDHDDIRVVIGRDDLISLQSQLGKDALGIDEILRAAQAHEADFRCAVTGAGHCVFLTG
jgi:hypothetical protein